MFLSQTKGTFYFLFGLALLNHSVAYSEEFLESSKRSNQLIYEKSPYLLQHAHNSVDWYPWGEEAFKKAREEQKPIFLSIGYSTCHWCHVMEKESFENEAIAEILNASFISIKVDREERPDVDQIYMQAVMAMTGSGGWPLSVFLTPEQKPFYGGTYFPPEDRWGRPGFTTVLQTLSQKWQSEREQILQSGERLTQLLAEEIKNKTALTQSAVLDEGVLAKAHEQFSSQFDRAHGGFGRAPKFPRSHDLSFLLRYWKRTQNEDALRMVNETLQAMAAGGIYDVLGGGFHRYATDEAWQVPHFEKMLYDQAMMALAYLDAYQVTGEALYAEIVRSILDYVMRDMTHPEGGFYSAEDADSAEHHDQPHEKSEGAFYIWRADEIESLLGSEIFKVFQFVYDVQPEGNVTADPHGEFAGKNIFQKVHSFKEAAEKFNQEELQIREQIRQARGKLFGAREKRPRPHLDDKVLTDWNGLMIMAFARAALVLEEPKYLAAAEKSAVFIINHLETDQGMLLHRWRDGEAAIPAFLDDYAFFSMGLFELYEASFESQYLEQAVTLLNQMIQLFWDSEAGGFYFKREGGETLIARIKEIYDGAIPSGNSVAALALLKAGRLTMNRDFEEKASQLLSIFSELIFKYPSGYTQMLMAVDFVLGPSQEIILVGSGKEQARAFLKPIASVFLPRKVMAFHPQGSPEAKKLYRLIPFMEKQTKINGKPSAYVCQNYVCNLPVTSTEAFKTQLERFT